MSYNNRALRRVEQYRLSGFPPILSEMVWAKGGRTNWEPAGGLIIIIIIITIIITISSSSSSSSSSSI